MENGNKRESERRPPRKIYLVVRDEARKPRPPSRLVAAYQRGVLTGLAISFVVLLARVYIDRLIH